MKPARLKEVRRAYGRHPLLLAAVLAALGNGALWFAPKICAAQDAREIYQVSSREAMVGGHFGDGPTIATLKTHGDFGLGTFDGFDGELIIVGGKVYQAKVDGPPIVPDDSMRTPFALVTFFQPSQTIAVRDKTNMKGLEQLIVGAMPSKKIYSAVRLTGQFISLRSRSIPAQNPPYQTLPQVLEHERIVNLRDVEATMVGFWSPPTMAEMSGSGLHLHFISADGKHGGHVLDCEFSNVKVELEPVRHIEIVLVDH